MTRWLLARIIVRFWMWRTGSAGVAHGPIVWPRWKLFSVSIVKQNGCDSGAFGWNVWIYTPRNGPPVADYKGVLRRNTGRSIDVSVFPCR